MTAGRADAVTTDQALADAVGSGGVGSGPGTGSELFPTLLPPEEGESAVPPSADQAALEAFVALRNGEWQRVLDLSAFLVAPERPALEARIAAWRGQALRALGRVEEAERAMAAAVQLARRAGDDAGVTELRTLHASILVSLAAARAAEQERARDAVLVHADDDALLAPLLGTERASILVRRANALADAGRPEDALACASRALREAEQAGGPRERILAMLCAARVAEPARWIHAAHAVADQADDHNLITAVAHAARAAGIPLHPPEF